ncbi:hypothetical protein FGB62_10g112 [Gracilaria domingensis]|nr:hypothetical protein FGB62_10g112 [Gracilaria domingensis]
MTLCYARCSSSERVGESARDSKQGCAVRFAKEPGSGFEPADRRLRTTIAAIEARVMWSGSLYSPKKRTVGDSRGHAHTGLDYGRVFKRRLMRTQRITNIQYRNDSATNRYGSDWFMSALMSVTCCHVHGRTRYRLEHSNGDSKVVRWDGAVKISGSVIVGWCTRRPNVSLLHDQADRLGLYYENNIGEKWAIDAVIFVLNDTVLRSRPGVKRVHGPRYYAHNHEEPVWRWHEMQGVWDGEIQCVTEYVALTDSQCMRFSAPPEIMDALDKYYIEHPMVPVRVSSSGAREESEHCKPYLLSDQRMLVCKTNEVCLHASLANAVAFAVNEEYAESQLLQGCLPGIISFRTAAQYVNTHVKRVVPKRVQMSREESHDKLQWMVRQTEGVFPLRLRAKNIDHVVCFDMSRMPVHDSVKQYSMLLYVGALGCSVGDPKTFERVVEVRRVRQVVGSGRANECGSFRRRLKSFNK